MRVSRRLDVVGDADRFALDQVLRAEIVEVAFHACHFELDMRAGRRTTEPLGVWYRAGALLGRYLRLDWRPGNSASEEARARARINGVDAERKRSFGPESVSYTH